MPDPIATVSDLKQSVARFVAARNWQQHHQPKHLAGSILIEAAELMEHFQWDPVESGAQVRMDEKRMQGIREEIADVLAYTLSLANALDIDLADALAAKMARNAEKYPVGHAGVARPAQAQ